MGNCTISLTLDTRYRDDNGKYHASIRFTVNGSRYFFHLGNKYTVDEFDKRFYMFAKANIDEEFNLYNLNYDHNLFIYPFQKQEIPLCIGIVPEVAELNVIPTKEYLDSIYEKYTNKVNRNVEGFVVNYKNNITKYVRMKNGKLQEHFDRGE